MMSMVRLWALLLCADPFNLVAGSLGELEHATAYPTLPEQATPWGASWHSGRLQVLLQ
jgi:hypothetical protein